MYFVSCPKQGLEMEAVVLHRVGFLEYFCPKEGQDFKPSAAPLYPNMGQVPPPGLVWLFTEKEHALGALGRNFRCDILWKVTNSSYCILINPGIWQNSYNMAFL